MRAALGVVALLGLAACPQPTDGTPQIAVSPNVAGRMNLLPGAHGGPKAPASTTGAHTHPMRAGEALGGPNATGKVGDWVLENDEVVFVIDALGGGEGFAESGGNLVDAADARQRKDELGQLFTYFGTFPRQAVYSAIDVVDKPNGTAEIIARGRELLDAKLLVETHYALAGGDRAMLMTTTLTNTNDAPVTLKAVGDAVQWGGVEKVASGKEVGFRGRSSGPFIGGVGRLTSYALTTPEAEIAAVSGGGWTDTEQAKDITIDPGRAYAYARVFAVGERADIASIVTELTKASGGEVGGVEITLRGSDGKPITAPAGAKVMVSTPAGAEVMSFVAPKDDAAFGGELPPGKWLLSYASSVGRRAAESTKTPIEVKKGVVARATLGVTDAAKLEASCADVAGKPLPCKITIEGLGSTPFPDLGPAFVAGPARNQLIAASEAVAMAPGKYRLTYTRGPEYGLESEEITLEPGQTKTTSKALRRIVDTSGYVATDFHQHSIVSADSPVATRDRVRANAAEGVEVAVASEHNAIVDLAPLAKELGLASWVVGIAGNELTTDASQKPWGHANVFPLLPETAKARGGAPVVRNRSAKDVLDEARGKPGPARVIQVNHPRSGGNGYFDLLGFDAKTGIGSGPGYDAGFDSIEVWNGRNVEMRSKVLGDFLALLRSGHPVTAIADTDTHGVVGQEPGLPRTFVRVTRDDALDTWDAARTDDLVKSVREGRDVVLSNGPFLKVTANGVGIGGVARGGQVDVKVHVTCAPFAAVDHAELRLAGSGKMIGQPQVALAPKKNAAGALEADATFTVRASADDAFVVIVSGPKPMRPMFTGDDQELTPWAMSGAIWIDADGDGKSLGR